MGGNDRGSHDDRIPLAGKAKNAECAMNTLATILLAAPGIFALTRLYFAVSHPSALTQLLMHIGRSL
jgi:hypothetical protein